jgi:uncharacterized protein YbcC (UPF0753/DUF2309 family)
MKQRDANDRSLSAACQAAANAAVRAVPPVWPLSSSVAVNPYLGQVDEPLEVTAARLGRVAGQPVTMTRLWYAERIARGEILDDDLDAARQAAPGNWRPATLAELKAAAERPSPRPTAVPTIADLASRALAIDCPRLVTERIGFFAAAYFDRGQAMWPAVRAGGCYKQWRAFAARDLTPEIIGITGFAAHVDHASENPVEAIERAADRLGLEESQLPTYFHSLLTTIGGWAQLARYELWQAELANDSDTTALELLAIRIVWEEALFELCEDDIAAEWQAAKSQHAAALEPTRDQMIDTILQEAAERAAQRRLALLLSESDDKPQSTRVLLHAVFCIDVRSEVFRRALESLDPTIRTSGFAGFFGLPTAHRGFASDVEEDRFPVLLPAKIKSRTLSDDDHDSAARFLARARRAWNRFKLAAVSSFAFVEATGPIYIAKLLRDALGWMGRKSPCAFRPVLDSDMDGATRVATAESILRAMSLTEAFAPVTLLLGHGASVVNNPHASALQCGACGGYSGEVNARLLAGLLNDQSVRHGLRAKGIEIPDDACFVGGLHDTTTDRVVLFDGDAPSPVNPADMARIRQWLERAGSSTRQERSARLPRASRGNDILARSRDWSEIRPELGLAGCSAFIAAPRNRTAGKDLAGRAFLHDYDWHKDDGFAVLELIMTAPVVVASWISLQYYGSTVAPELFGAGNKLLHNVIGGFGVVEGNGGSLRPGLPWQSVHDGDKLAHEPLRLSVCIEAPTAAMTEILGRHDYVRALFDNRWAHLFALDEQGRLAWRYVGDHEWLDIRNERRLVLERVA